MNTPFEQWRMHARHKANAMSIFQSLVSQLTHMLRCRYSELTVNLYYSLRVQHYTIQNTSLLGVGVQKFAEYKISGTPQTIICRVLYFIECLWHSTKTLL